MTHDDVRKLLGGYPTGTLTDAERKALFEAAMEDQSLFDAIADDGVLKELLDDPQVRTYLLAALPVKPEPVVKRMPAWNWAAVASAAATLVIGGLLVWTPMPLKLAVPRTMASPPINAEPQAPATFKAEPEPQLAKQKTYAPAVVVSKRASAETSPRPALAAPLPSPDRDAQKPVESDAKLQADKEAVAPVAAAENRKKVELPVYVDAVRTQPALPGQPAVSNTLSTVSGALTLMDRAAQTQQSARQLFYSPVYGTGVAAGFVAGRYDATPAAKRTVAAQPAGTPGLRYTLLRRQPDGSFLEAEPATIFHAGDAVCLSIETNSAGYLAIWNGRAALANLSVLARTKYTVPAEGAIDLSGPPGDRKLLVIFSRALQAKPAGPVGGLLVEQSTERTTYVADPRPSGLVSFEIILSYR